MGLFLHQVWEVEYIRQHQLHIAQQHLSQNSRISNISQKQFISSANKNNYRKFCLSFSI